MKNIGNSIEGTIRVGDAEGMILISTTPNHRGEFHWNSSICGRRGKGNFQRRHEALMAGVKAMNVKIDSWSD